MNRLLIFVLLAVLSSFAQTPDAVVKDPLQQKDRTFAPRMVELHFAASDKSMLNGIMYMAAGTGPHPTAILLHGFPGNEQNLDLAQSMRRAGWNVFYFHYRGALGKSGRLQF